jgi:hypothetical protein
MTAVRTEIGAESPATRIPFAPNGSISATDTQRAVEEVASDATTALNSHLSDAEDAHDASAISVLDSGGNYTATDVEAALAEVMDALQAHEADTTDAHDASAISYAGAAGMSATDVEGAIDELAADVAALDQAVVLKGTWDASSGSFPGGGTAQAGWSYIVSVGGTVDSVSFAANDRIVAIADNASTSTYAANWHKLDYTDQVLSVNGATGAVSLDAGDIPFTPVGSIAATDVQTAIAELDGSIGSPAAADVGFTPAGNIAATNVQAAIEELDTEKQAVDAQLSSLIRQNSQSAAYGLVIGDSGYHILHPSSDDNARTFTIPANASVAYSIGTVIVFVNKINTVTIAITSDTLTLMGSGATGSRSLAANGMAVALKIASTEWAIAGINLV